MGAQLPASRAIRKSLRSSKGLLIIILAALAGVAMAVGGAAAAGPGLAGAVGAAAAIDAVVLRWRRGRWTLPDGAILTGLIVAMILSPQEPWHVTTVTSVLAIATKHSFRTRAANVFNPAALAVVVTFYVSHTGLSWWGALPDAPVATMLLLLVTGVFIADRVNRMPLVLVFTGCYFLLFTAAAYLGDARHVTEIFRSPDVQAVLFFALFILTDPPTSPIRYGRQVVYGVLVAVASFAIFMELGAAHYLLSGVLVGNILEAWWRVRARRTRARLATVTCPG